MADRKASAVKRPRRLGFAGVRLAVVKRGKAVVLVPIMAAAAAFAIASCIPDRYAASVLVQIDPRQISAESADSEAASGPHALDAEEHAIAAQMAALQSASLIDGVAERLHLADDPEFQARSLASWLGSPFVSSDPKRTAREAIASQLTVVRVHRSSLVRIRFSSRDAEKAQRIASALAAAYIGHDHSMLSLDGTSEPRSEPTASEKVFQSLLSQYGARMLSATRVVEEASVPQRPEGPKRTRIAGGVAAASFALMLMIAVLLERNALIRTRDVEEALACPHMSSLPAVGSREALHAPARNARLILAEPECRYAKAVRSVSLELSARTSEGKAERVILITSALPGEGAELFASNIAHDMAVNGEASLLVDCDFRARRLTRQLAPESERGFHEQIASGAPVEEAILRDGLTGVCFLPAAGPAPGQLANAALLRSAEFSEAFKHLKARFPTMVISAPALLPFSDARILADLADQIVFLTAWHRTPHDLAKKALASLEANQRKVVGAILTESPDDDDTGFMSLSSIFEELRRASRSHSLDHAA